MNHITNHARLAIALAATSALFTLALTLPACGTQSSSAEYNPCGDNGELRSFDGEDYCLYRQAIQETGFSCPSGFAFEQTYGEARVCGQHMTPPKGFKEHIEEVLMAPVNQNPNTMTPDSGVVVTVDMGGGGSCDQGDADLAIMPSGDEPMQAATNVGYSAIFSISGVSSAQVEWTLLQGVLPDGLELIKDETLPETARARISGTPTTPGTYSFIIEARIQPAQSGSNCAIPSATESYTIVVADDFLNCGEGEVEASTCLQCGPANGCDQVGRRCTKTCTNDADCGADFDGVCEQGICREFQCG